jgi:hypothetical protein
MWCAPNAPARIAAHAQTAAWKSFCVVHRGCLSWARTSCARHAKAIAAYTHARVMYAAFGAIDNIVIDYSRAHARTEMTTRQ